MEVRTIRVSLMVLKVNLVLKEKEKEVLLLRVDQVGLPTRVETILGEVGLLQIGRAGLLRTGRLRHLMGLHKDLAHYRYNSRWMTS